MEEKTRKAQKDVAGQSQSLAKTSVDDLHDSTQELIDQVTIGAWLKVNL